MRAYTISVVLLALLPFVVSERILFLSPIGSKSHKIFYMGIVEELIKRGHHVTMLSAYKPLKTYKNVTEVIIPFDIDEFMPSNIFEHADEVIFKLITESPDLCSKILSFKEVQEVFKEKFDLVALSMFLDMCFLTFPHRLQVPFVYLSPAGLVGPLNDIVNNIEFTSIVPNKLSEAQFPLKFKDRLLSTLVNTALGAAFKFYTLPRMDSVCRERGLCPEDMPGLKEMSDKASLAIVNSIRTLEYPARPVNPNIIYAGGAHIKPPKRLPEDLERWVEDSGEHGFILFSLGSALKPSLLPERYRKILINVFGSLKQKVLWKWNEESMPDLPKNVKLSKWLPQSDILGHPKLRLFITHGGLLSTQESTYNGIPVIGMPVFADQFANIKEAENEGWAKLMQWKELEETTFRQMILDTINDKSLKVVSKQRSALFRDQPIPPAEAAAFWMEYVIRHEGALHLLSATINMSWYEVYNMDVWALIIGVLLCIIYLSFRFLKFILYKCFVTKKSSKGKRKNE